MGFVRPMVCAKSVRNPRARSVRTGPKLTTLSLENQTAAPAARVTPPSPQRIGEQPGSDRFGGVRTTVIEPGRAPGIGSLHDLWAYRDLLALLAWRDISARYKQTALGVAWAIVQPVTAMVVFTVLFGRLAEMPSNGTPYPVFVLTALVPWTFFAGALTQATNSLVGNANLITKVYFPRLLLPAATITAGIVDLSIGLVVLAGMCLAYGVTPGPALFALPALVGLTFMMALGVGALLATVNVWYRDVRHAVPFGLQLWLFATPVIYPINWLPESWRWVAVLNPLAGLINAYRAIVLSTPLDVAALVISCIAAVVLCGAGVFCLRKTERTFADVV